MKDIRDFIAKCEEEGILHRIKAPVDVNLELSHTAKLAGRCSYLRISRDMMFRS